MKPVLLCDFGSTYTKLTAVDADTGELLGVSQSRTTVLSDISEGMNVALTELTGQSGVREFAETYACSSAAGGLRMVACGLVKNLTAEAATRAALGAGAKVLKTFAFEMTEADRIEIERISPDIVLLCGGTDGGNSACAIHNAEVLSRANCDFPVVVACNRNAADECERILTSAGREVIKCENVMPTFGVLSIEPCRRSIRDLFLRRIVSAKGLSRAQELLNDIILPTPAAVLDALELLSEDLGELVAVDLGGATTDIYSITEGLPTSAGTVLKGLPEPFAKRTVEGDIGMRYSSMGVIEAAGIERVMSLSGETEAAILDWTDRIRLNPEILSHDAQTANIDFALAALAIETGLTRHAGVLEKVYTPLGAAYQQTGKDLTRVERIVLTGGMPIHSARGTEMAEAAMRNNTDPNSLTPKNARVLLDKHYILSAAGLLKKSHPKAAKALLWKEFG